MEIANCRLRLNKVGSDVPLKDVTPAEAMFLHIIHGPQNGGMSFGEEFSKIEVVGQAMVVAQVPDKVEPDTNVPAKAAVGVAGQPNFVAAVPASVVKGKVVSTKEGLVPRTDAQELKRLSAKYNGARNKKNEPIINTIWPDKLNPKLPQNFKDIDWTAASELGAGTELGGLNYATGGIAQTTL